MAYSVFNSNLGGALLGGAAKKVQTAKPAPAKTPVANPNINIGNAFASGASALTNKGLVSAGKATYNSSGGITGTMNNGTVVSLNPTNYSAGTTIKANTPQTTGIIGANNLTPSVPLTGASTYAGSSPVLPGSAPSAVGLSADALSANNIALGLNADGTAKIDATTGTTTGATTEKPLSAYEQYKKDYGIPEPVKPESITDAYYSSPAYQAEQMARQQMNNTQNQINAITTRLNLDVANLRGVGAREGVTEAVYGQQASEVIREGNNLLLPLQAQLAADQGNLELATSTLNTWMKFKMQDIENEYNYKKDIRDSIIKFADADQAARIKKADTIAQQAFEMKKLGVQQDYDMKKQATQFGYDKALKQMGIDAETAKTVKANTPLNMAQAQGSVQQISDLLSSGGLNSAVGPNRFARTSVFEPFTGKRSNFVAGVEQLRSQLSLDSLINAKAKGATFGALSDQEMRILSNSATKLSSWANKDKNGNVVSYTTTEREFRKELDKINNFAKLDYLLRGGSPEDVNVRVMPDKTYWTANSDGTFTQLQ